MGAGPHSLKRRPQQPSFEPVFKKSELDGGLKIVSERHFGAKAFAVGIFINVGTRDESNDVGGIAHLTEHMVFKGTKTKSAFDIAKSLESLGGELNAYTSKEYTCFHALVLKDHWKKAVEVLLDLVTNMEVSKTDFEREKSVVLQEIVMCKENYEDLAFEAYLEHAFKGHSLGKPILGTEQSIPKISYSDVKTFIKSHFVSSQIVISFAGDLDHDEFVGYLQKLKKMRIPQVKKKLNRKPPRVFQFQKTVPSPSEQYHLLCGFKAASFLDPQRFEAFILSTLLGGGMTSKLYQSVREKKGLAYSVYSSLNTFTDCGLMLVYAGSEKRYVKELLGTFKKEIVKVKKTGVSQTDLKHFGRQIIGQLLLGADDVENRMSSLGVNELVFGCYKPLSLIVDEIKKVTPSSVSQYSEEYLDVSHMGVLLLGPQADEFSKNLNFN